MVENEDPKKPSWSFKPEEKPASSKKELNPPPEVKWAASEFIHHHKSFGWYFSLLGGIALLCGLIYVFTKDIISIAATAIVGLLFAVLASRKPRELPYQINERGITIGQKLYPYSLFKSFAIAQEGAFGSINLMPLKRFMPELAIHFPTDQETKIVEILAFYLPQEEHQEHSVDKLMKHLRF